MNGTNRHGFGGTSSPLVLRDVGDLSYLPSGVVLGTIEFSVDLGKLHPRHRPAVPNPRGNRNCVPHLQANMDEGIRMRMDDTRLLADNWSSSWYP
ncbi:MAG: hypothetical protein IPJ48_01575 [Propionivibrio sp.]|uniref:Uncharacterized protein n=1 Tax=Candidatus Propionivibrio dominans TaxID=2954373 RepID=A0A9D7I785_9RHOO|nr:hypothetical protein [Candidatus Propionivibrio dominans]